MAELRPLAVGDAEALWRFEVDNRTWFEAHLGPRPPTYWEVGSLRDIIRGQVVETATSDAHFVIVEAGSILGRLALTGRDGSVAYLGVRVAQAQCGKGHATQAVLSVLEEAELRSLWAIEARVKTGDLAMTRVLEKAGFSPVETSADVTLYRCAMG